jgi:hypothetical protein
METPDKTDLANLAERIAHARILRDHHLWEAVRCLSIDIRRSDRPARQMAELVAAGAMLDAAMLLVCLPESRRSVATIRNVEGRWSCTVQAPAAPKRKSGKTFTAEHCDLPAAILAAFITSHLQSRRGSARKAAPPERAYRQEA